MTVLLNDIIDGIHRDNQNRDAFHSIVGYFYQFELTLLHILTEGTEKDAFEEELSPAIYKVETIEDYVKYCHTKDKSHIRVAQIKHHSKGVTDSKYYDAVLWLYLNYLKFLQLKIDKETSYKAIIFQYDPNGEKDIQTVLESAFNSYEIKRKKELEKMKKDGSDKIPKHNVWDKICETRIDTDQNREEFYKIARFKATKSHKEISDELKMKLHSYFGDLKDGYTPEFLYGAAITKLIEDGQNGLDLTFESLKSYFHGVPYEMNDFYTQKIIDFIFSVVDSNLSDIEFDMGFDDTVTESYKIIYNHVIKPFLKEKLIENELRCSFLKSIAPKELKNFTHNSSEEFMEFLTCSSPIANFLSKLAKILYFHEAKENGIGSLEDWFKINEKAWLFKYPDETRGIGVITGDIYGESFYACLRHFLPRLKLKDIRPDVWYMGHDDDDFNASRNLNYEIDITLPREERKRLTFCEVEDDHFHVQCMGCLSRNKFEKINTVPNIFVDGCFIRGDNS
ncbi:hypothetical protein M1K46_11655 [Fictibacillus sp. WQ 8-8]|uniref:hypothetical protein n=1 Tax=Fictibacillus sp. WQ 8-8 TaxID=2938788 RepID=UPI00210B82F2|nr:hypothetical protein [Fictibacillus sp. WQ 8-8]MCQ6266314.1 hypothetical protein [Fictibacillus sp. WQ 8-8]